MEGRPLYRTVAAVGLLAHALSSLVHAMIVGSADRMFFVVLGLVAAVAAAVTWSWTKGIFVSLVVGLLLEVATFWFVFPITMGFAVSALDAVPALVGFVGVWTAIIASIRGVLHRREPRAYTESTRRRLLMGAAVVALLGVISTALTFMNQEEVSAEAAEGGTEVVMRNFDEFAPTRYEVTAGQEAKFVVRNDDPVGHTFTVEDYDVNEVVGPGSSKVISFTPTKAGRVELICDFHSDMRADIVVS